MENNNAQKLIEKIQKEILKNNFVPTEIVETLKKIREYALQEQNPTVTKSLRLAYEHIEENSGFCIAIPDDEPIDEDEETTSETNAAEHSLESFDYFLSLIYDLSKKNNLLDLKDYNTAFLNY